MVALRLSLLLISFITTVRANPVFRNLVVHEARQGIPSGFLSKGPAAADTQLNLRIALVQSDTAGLEAALLDVSNPSSANYGNHLSMDEVETFVRPSVDTVAKVNDWLATNGLQSTTSSPAGDWLSVSMPVKQANELLRADFTVFAHHETGKQAIRTLSYSIPIVLKDTWISSIRPLRTFPNPRKILPVFSSPINSVSNTAVPSSCASVVTPACLQALYGIPTTKATQSSNALGVSGFLNQFANQADLTTFLKNLRPDISSTTTFTLQTLDGGRNPQSPKQAGIEANLDIQYTVGVASGVPVTFISVGDDFQDGNLEGFLDIINFLLGEPNPPQVLTTSYGQDERTISSILAKKVCNAYAQLGARGVSILFASGDGGVSGSQTQSCTTFVPTFPSGCPFMTSVGATTGITPETAADFSSGGFSNIFSRPDYQITAVSTYLIALGGTNLGKFNRTGRGFPDVATQGENVEVVLGGQTETVAGTSCSSPIFASIISLINDQLFASGKSPLGFLNPFLYANPGAFNDITSGNNPGCNTNGFPAKAGWDPVTGLGTPNFDKLKKAAGL
ncbi:family S53 protease [Rickenella mellea]|uniref:tripeptidyl-peptidase II n=1 Tax=Rickenella mellea TaxID=50990 RepID=A0A4Y7PP76_9AGAM|nr:family S53 protease [Rickenella mellea]